MLKRIPDIATRFAFVSYLLVFLLLFLQFPLQDSLPGKVDTWFFVTAFETMANEFLAGIQGEAIGNALFPESAVYPFGNYSPAYAIFYLPFRMVGFSPLWAYYFFFSLLFVGNAFGMFLIGKQLLKHKSFAFLAGLVFATCNFAFGSMDNPDALGFFPALLAVCFFLRFLEEKKGKWFLYTVLAGSLEVYFSSYAFLFGCVVLGIIGLGNLKQIFGNEALRRNFFEKIPLFVIILIPYALVYIFGDAKASAWNPGEAISSVAMVSLNPEDVVRHLPENLLWPSMDGGVGTHNWLAGTRSAGIGMMLWLLGLLGWWKWKKKRMAFGAIWLVGLVLALGPSINLGGNEIPMILYPLYKFFHIQNFFRISIRAWFICIGIFSLSAAYALQWVSEKRPQLWWVVLIFCGLIFLENIPLGLHTYGNGKFLQLPQAEKDIFPKSEKPVITLDLPSGFYSGFHPDFPAICSGEPVNLFEHQVVREYVYMYWQTLHKQHSLNGFTGFIPQTRIENQRLIVHLTERKNLEKLLLINGIDFVIFHKDLELDCEDGGELEHLRKSNLLEVVKEDKEVVVFRQVNPMVSI